MEIQTTAKRYSFLNGGGEMGELTRSFDWSQTSLGSIDEWPQSLRTTLSIILHSGFPMFLFWGEDHTCFYNDAYRPSLGQDGKHPYALGRPGAEIWPEIWADIKPLINQVLSGGNASWAEDQLLPIYRNGQLEDVYWTFSYSPVSDETGHPAGVFVTCTETTKKVQTLAALKESKEQLSFAIEATGLGVWDLDPVTRKFKANDRLKEWFGLAPGDEIDLPAAMTIIAEKDRDTVSKAIEKALQYGSGGLYDIEYTIINPLTQRERIVRAKGQAWFNGDQIAWRFNGTLQDITEYVVAMRKLEASEQQVRTLVESAPFPIAVYTGEEMRIQLANQAIINIYGKGDDVIGKSYSDILPELENQDIFNQVRGVLHTGIPFHAKNQRVDIVVAGRLRPYYFNYSFTPLFDSTGAVYGVMNTAAEVTDLVVAKQQLEASEARLRAISANAPIAIGLYAGPDFILQDCNEAFLDILGKGHNVNGLALAEVMPELASEQQPFMDLLRQVYTTGRGYSHPAMPTKVVHNGVLKDFFYHFSYTPLLDNEHKVYAILGIAMDVTESVIGQKRLEESEANLRNMILQSPVAMCILKGPLPVVEIANELMLELMGKTSEEVSGRALFDAVPELRNEGLEALLEKVRSTGETYKAYGAAFNLQRGNSIGRVYVDFVYEPYFEKDNSITAVIVVAIDVTEQVTARKKIESSESRFRLMADAMPQFVWTGDAEGKINYYNEAVYNYSGFTLEELENDGWSRIVHPDDRAENIAAWANSIRSGETFIFQHRFRSRNGNYRWQLSRAVPQRDSDGTIRLWIGTSTDIHEQKIFAEELEKQVWERTRELENAQVSLREANHYLQQIINKFDSALASLVPIFEDGRIVDFYFKMTNLAYTPYSRLLPEQIVNRRVGEVFPGYFQTEAFGKYVETFETGKNNEWVLHYNVDGLNVYLQLTVCKMDQEVVVNFTDITSLKNLQLDLLNKLKELERSNEELQQFAHVASHDLKEPVRKIRTFGSRIMTDFADDLPDKAKYYLEKIDSAASRIYAMIDGVLRYSSLNIADQAAEPVPLDKIMLQVQEDLELMIRQKNAVISWQQLPVIEASPLLIYQLFYNLVNNALKFSKAGVAPVISISSTIHTAGDNNRPFAMIRIADNGIGFKQDFAGKIFKTFIRLNSKDQYEGTGLGLSLCQKIAERFGGSIQAEASDGEGAVFTVMLPLNQ